MCAVSRSRGGGLLEDRELNADRKCGLRVSMKGAWPGTAWCEEHGTGAPLAINPYLTILGHLS